MSRHKGVRVMVETNGVIANVAGFDKAEETWQDVASGVAHCTSMGCR